MAFRPLVRRFALGAVVAVAALAGSLAIPHDRYIRWQEMRSEAWARLGWIYERVHFGVCQRSCPVPHQAASLILRSFVSRSGLRQTSPTGDQLRIWRDHRVGLAARASV